MNLTKILLLVIVIVAGVSGCGSLESKQPPVAIEGTIVFASPHQGGQYADIYLLDAQGARLLTGGGNTIWANPVWSPDGTQIAFITDKWQLAVVKRDGSSGVTLTPESNDSSLWAHDPAWLPDGNISIALGGKLLILAPDGSGVRVLTPHNPRMSTPSFTVDRTGLPPNESPAYAWSPDGNSIVFDCSMFQTPEVCLFDLQSGESRTLLEAPEPFQAFAWSPDGTMIVGAMRNTSSAPVDPNEQKEDLYVFDVNGQGLHALAHQPGEEVSPAWSPDGKQIAYEFSTKDAEGSTFGLQVINADGSAAQQLVGTVGFRGPEMDDETVGLFGRHPDWTVP